MKRSFKLTAGKLGSTPEAVRPLEDRESSPLTFVVPSAETALPEVRRK